MYWSSFVYFVYFFWQFRTISFKYVFHEDLHHWQGAGWGWFPKIITSQGTFLSLQIEDFETKITCFFFFPSKLTKLNFNIYPTTRLENLENVIYNPFHKTLPKSSTQMHWISVRFYAKFYKERQSQNLLSYYLIWLFFFLVQVSIIQTI